MYPGIDFGYFKFPEFADAVSGEIFLFKVHIYGLPANAEIFCDFFDGEPSVFYQIKLFHCNIPETPKLSFFLEIMSPHTVWDNISILLRNFKSDCKKSVNFILFFSLTDFFKMNYKNRIGLAIPYDSKFDAKVFAELGRSLIGFSLAVLY